MLRLIAECPNFLACRSDAGYNPKHRFEILKKLGGQVTFRPRDAQAIIRLAADRLEKLAKGADVMIGVQKKGMSLLLDILCEVRVDLQRYSNQDVERGIAPLKGKSVLVVEDSVHNGKKFPELAEKIIAAGARKITLLAVLTSSQGINRVRERLPEVEVHEIVPTPEEDFGRAFANMLSPILNELRVGAISDRPSKVFLIAAPSFDAQKSAFETIAEMSRLETVERIEETATLGGEYGRVFHATLVLRKSAVDSIAAAMGSDVTWDQDPKIRIYVDPTSALRVHAYAILWPHGPRDWTDNERDAALSRGAERTLSLLAEELSKKMVGRGYSFQVQNEAIL